jgi:rod shape-determining protein MreD
MDGLLQRMDAAARNLFPVGLALAALLIGGVPLYLPGYGAVAPNLALMAVFYWAIYRPDLFPAAVAFGVGLIQDALMGTPLGLNALVLLCVHGVVVTQRRFFQGKTFAVVWSAFSVVAFAAAFTGWLLVMMLGGVLIAPWPGLFSMGLTVALYPFATWLLARVHGAIQPAGLHVSR